MGTQLPVSAPAKPRKNRDVLEMVSLVAAINAAIFLLGTPSAMVAGLLPTWVICSGCSGMVLMWFVDFKMKRFEAMFCAVLLLSMVGLAVAIVREFADDLNNHATGFFSVLDVAYALAFCGAVGMALGGVVAITTYVAWREQGMPMPVSTKKVPAEPDRSIYHQERRR